MCRTNHIEISLFKALFCLLIYFLSFPFRTIFLINFYKKASQMATRISTRRSAIGKTPCQEILNVFTQHSNPQLNLIPDQIWKSLPTTQKVSCETIQKMKQFKPNLSSQEVLKELRDNARIQLEEIMKLANEDIEPDNASPIIQEPKVVERQNNIKKYESPIRKMIKRENPTMEISEYSSQELKHDNIFTDNHVIDQLQDYLCID